MKQNEKEEIKKTLRKEYIKLTREFLKKTDEKIDSLVAKSLGSYTDALVDKTLQSFDSKIRKEENKVEDLSDALVDVMSHLMAQNELIAELLVSKGLMDSDDIKVFQKETENRVPELIKVINQSVGRKPKSKKQMKTLSKRHPETIKTLKKINKERKNK